MVSVRFVGMSTRFLASSGEWRGEAYASGCLAAQFSVPSSQKSVVHRNATDSDRDKDDGRRRDESPTRPVAAPARYGPKTVNENGAVTLMAGAPGSEPATVTTSTESLLVWLHGRAPLALPRQSWRVVKAETYRVMAFAMCQIIRHTKLL